MLVRGVMCMLVEEISKGSCFGSTSVRCCVLVSGLVLGWFVLFDGAHWLLVCVCYRQRVVGCWFVASSVCTSGGRVCFRLCRHMRVCWAVGRAPLPASVLVVGLMEDWPKVLWRDLMSVGVVTAVESTGRDGVSSKRRKGGLFVGLCVREAEDGGVVSWAHRRLAHVVFWRTEERRNVTEKGHATWHGTAEERPI